MPAKPLNCVATIFSADIRRSSATVLAPSVVTKAAPIFSASSKTAMPSDVREGPMSPPLSAMALLNNPVASGEIITMAQMAQRELTRLEQLRFAEEAARIRYGNGRPTPFPPETLFEARRSVDIGDDLWRVYNVHERLMQGGDSGRSTRGRSLRSRAIRENVRINTDLWQLPWRGWSTGSFCIFEH